MRGRGVHAVAIVAIRNRRQGQRQVGDESGGQGWLFRGWCYSYSGRNRGYEYSTVVVRRYSGCCRLHPSPVQQLGHGW